MRKKAPVSFRHTRRRIRSFTLVELLTSIAIIAMLVAVVIPMIANYTATARQTADRQALQVLNDAISRYKMQGGNVNALTAGKPFDSLLETLQTPVSWNGVTHQFLRDSDTFPAARTLDAAGSGSSYRLTAFNSYDSGGGSQIPMGGDPAFGGEIQRFFVAPYTHSAYNITLASNVEIGKRLVMAYSQSTSQDNIIASVTDSRGNTWTKQIEYSPGTVYIALISCAVTTALQAGDTITITYIDNSYRADRGALLVIENATQAGAAYSAGAYSTTVNVTGSISGAPSVLIGIVSHSTAAYTSTWTQSGTDLASSNSAVLYTTATTNGSKTLGGTLSPTDNYIGIWAEYY